MAGHSRVGSKEWWLKHIEERNSAGLQPILRVKEDDSKEQKQDHLYVVRAEAGAYRAHDDDRYERQPEIYLIDCFKDMGVFDKKEWHREMPVKLGNYEAKIDLLAQGFDSSQWVTEFKIIEDRKEVGEKRMPINVGKMGEAIGQSLLYSWLLWKNKGLNDANPAICTWLLGSGSEHIIQLCRRLGITLITMDCPEYVALYTKHQALRIYYLEDDYVSLLGVAK